MIPRNHTMVRNDSLYMIMEHVRLNGSAVYWGTLNLHQGRIFLGLLLWCSSVKGYILQPGGGARLQPHGLGLNPAQTPKMNECIKMRSQVGGRRRLKCSLHQYQG